MAISYDDWKKQYEGMTTEQQKNYANMVKGNATATEYANRYIQEKQNAGTFGQQTIKTSTTQQQPMNWYISDGNVERPQQQTQWVVKTITPEEQAESIRKAQEQLAKQNQQFDSSKLTNPNAQITVKQGTAAQTWLPDYQDTSDAREQEIINNLNAYWNNPANKSFFSDRATFNSTFHYDERNDRQKAILDSFWKGTENYNKATSYTDWKSFNTALNSWNVTEAQYAGMKDWNPEVFKEWQDQLKEEMNLAISNLSKITTNYDNAEILQTMMEKLWIEPQQWRDIIGWWEEMMDRTWAWSTMKDATKARESYNAVADKMTSIMNRYSSSTWGNQSDALVAARLQKALAPYQQQAQNYYSAWQMANTEFQTKLGTANNYASTIQAQAAEDQRIFQQKLTSLGFAMQVNSYRTPEQQAALQLQTQQIQNNMALYQQSRLNELSLYNQKQLNDLNLQYQEDLTKLQNKLSYELKDLSVEDPEQLKANLNNILTDYFSKYWDIIQRSQSQVVEDVIAYAKEHWISVAQALKENFIEPLQNKQEYKNAIAKNYAAPVTQWVSINWDWSIDFWATTYWGVKYTPVSEVQLYSWMRDFTDNKLQWQYWGQCWKFVNDYLQSIWLNRIYDNSLSSKLNSINTDKNDLSNLSVWSIAVFDYKGIDSVSENARKYGHVAIVTEIDAANNRVKIKESNYDWKWTINTRWVKTDWKTLQGFFDPSKWSNQSSLSNVDEAKKQNYIEEAKRWMLTDTMIWKIWDIAAEQWWSTEWNEALKQGKSTNLTDAQIKLMDKTDATFNSNAIVKEFESAINQIEQLQTALNDNSWVWDMSAIFTFMKTLDPSSVVRESEFNSAAATAWILNPSAIWQKLEKNANWKFLTKAQREDFKKIAIEFIKTKASNYNVKYNDLLKRYWEYWIDPNLAPTNMAELVISQLENWNTNNNKTPTNWYDQYTTVWLTWAWNVVTVWGTAYSSNFYDN